ncbi:unnamed protein product [Withania somnifera]
MGRSPISSDKNGLKKGPWTQEEDLKLIQYIQVHGPGNWRSLPKNAGLERCGKSCRLRWTNYLRPDIKRGRFSFEEEETIIQLHSVLGNNDSFAGRTYNEIKNYWNTHISKRLLKMGLDPVTHSPRFNLLDLLSVLLNSTQHNLSSLLGLQTLVNPQVLRLATLAPNIFASLAETNSETLLQKVEENQFLNTQIQNHEGQQVLLQKIQENQFSNAPLENHTSNISQPNNQLQNKIQEIHATCSQSTVCPYLVNSQKLQENMMLPWQTYGQDLKENSSNQDFSFEDETNSYCNNFMKFEDFIL